MTYILQQYHCGLDLWWCIESFEEIPTPDHVLKAALAVGSYCPADADDISRMIDGKEFWGVDFFQTYRIEVLQ